MTKLRLAQFSGEIPRLITRLLPDTGAQHAENVRLDDGGLTPIRKQRLEHSFTSINNIQTIYRHLGEWLSWDNVVNAAPGPVAADRLYYTGDGVPKMRVGSTVYPLALPFPSTALTATVTGTGSGNVITRLYVYTFVTEFGEESEPCPISAEVNWQSGKTVTLSGFQVGASGRGITKQRIYRSQTSNQAGTDLFFLEERDVSTADWVDTYGPESFGEVLPSRDWNAPPDDLSGIISTVNGMLVAFSGKRLYFCEPFRPHAWPEKYVLTMDYDIVALGYFGTTIAVMTKGQPYTVSGVSPENMVQEKLELNLPCINARGVVDLGYSVAYPANDGLVVISSSGATVATDALFTRPQWQKVSPGTLVAGQFAGRYFASYSYTEIDGVTKTEGTLIIDLTGAQPFILRTSFKAESFFYDVKTSQLFYLIGNNVYEYDAIGKTNEVMTWKSKRFALPSPVTMGAILVESNEVQTAEEKEARRLLVAEIEAHNAPIFSGNSMGSEMDAHEIDGMGMNADPLLSLPPDKFISVRVYADGELIATVSTMDQAKRIPARNARYWEIQVNGTAAIEQIRLATTVRELGEN